MELFWCFVLLFISTANGEDSQSSENDKRITVTFSTITSPDQFQRQMKIAHNNIRANEAVETQASDMTKMQTGSSLVKIAQMVANKCIFKHSSKEEKSTITSNFNYIGENIFASTNANGQPQNILNAWYKEKANYDYQTVSCSRSPCGHYTQVVWAESKFLGCALKFCPKLEIPKTGKTWYNAYLAVCEYGPGGNKNNVKPYRKGGVCATCPGECIDNKLCRKYYTEADLARRAMDTDNGNELKDETRGLLERLEELIEREIPEVATTPSPNGGEETEIVL